MARAKPAKTISDIFEEFLAVQKDRIGHKTFSKYQSIISLYKSYLEGYWPGHDGEYDKITKAGGTYCDTFGAEDAMSGCSEFLGYFMPRKVMCGKDTMQAAGTVTKKLAKWKRCEATSTCSQREDAERFTSTRRIQTSPQATELRWRGGQVR